MNVGRTPHDLAVRGVGRTRILEAGQRQTIRLRFASRELAELKRQVSALQSVVRARMQMRVQIGVLSVSSRIAFIDAAGLHGMEGRYATAGLTARDMELLQKALIVASKVACPAELREDALELRTELRKLVAAYRAGNRAATFEALKAAHEAQHALSAAAYD